MKTTSLLSLCERTFATLDRALAEGYENVLANSPDETASEIGEYDATLANVPHGLMVQLVTLWLVAPNAAWLDDGARGQEAHRDPG